MKKTISINLSLIYFLSLILFLTALTYCSEDNSPVEQGPDTSTKIEGYTLIWNDEFDGSSIDNSKWNHEVNANGGGNNELQYYTARPENSYLQDGKLFIIGKKEQYTGPDGVRSYTSARITTEATNSFQYGKITALIKLPYGQGIWPAFWMLGTNISQVGWPKCGEIDIMEMIGGGDGRDNVVHGTLHWDNFGHRFQGGSTKLSNGILADDFHEFTIDWNEEKIEWSLDGIKYYELSISPQEMSAFHNNFFIIINLAIGGNWPGNPSPETVFPQEMVVDYVRVYEKD